MASENKLIQKCREGNQKYMKLLYDKYSAKMFGVCLRYFSSVEQAQDALQDGFIKVFTKLKTYEGKGSFEGWIRRIMVTTSLNIIRKDYKHYFHEDISEFDEKISDNVFNYDHLHVEELLKLVQKLPHGYRTVFNLYEIEGYSHKEIAEMLEVSENTSKSQLLKARHHLRKQLERM